MWRKIITGILMAAPCLLVAGAVAFSVSKPISAERPETLDEYDITELQALLSQQTMAEKVMERETESGTEAVVVSDAKYKDGTHYGIGTGFAGKIKVCVVVENTKIKTVSVVEVEADDVSFVDRAKGLIDQVIKTQKPDVDVVSGATYSSRGIIEAIKNALTGETSGSTPVSNSAAIPTTPADTTDYKESETGYKNGTYYGTGTGFGGTIKVKTVVKKSRINAISVVEAPGEGASYLESAKTMIPKMIKKQSPNVDAVSGATFTSNGIINAVKSSLEQAKKTSSSKKKDKTKETEAGTEIETQAQTESEVYEKPAAFIDGTYTATSEGFRGAMTVTVVISGGKITDIQVDSKDDEPFITNAKQLIAMIIAVQNVSGIDAISGATYSSNGILNGVKLALKQAAAVKESAEETEKSTGKSTEKSTEKPQEETKDDENPTTYQDGVYIGSAKGFDYIIQATVTISGGAITGITAVCPDDYDDEEWLADCRDRIVGDVLKKQNADGIDAVTNATFSSNGLINAIKQALEQAKMAGE